jgi:hypothetical protein
LTAAQAGLLRAEKARTRAEMEAAEQRVGPRPLPSGDDEWVELMSE